MSMAKKKKKNPCVLASLCVVLTDLSAGLVNVLTDIIWKSTIDWHAGNVGCKTVRYAQGVVTYASTYALVALSLDRLHAIARPLGFTGSSEFIVVLVVGSAELPTVFSCLCLFCTWLLSVSVSLSICLPAPLRLLLLCVFVCVCVCVCAHARACAWVHACMRACVHVYMCGHKHICLAVAFQFEFVV